MHPSITPDRCGVEYLFWRHWVDTVAHKGDGKIFQVEYRRRMGDLVVGPKTYSADGINQTCYIFDTTTSRLSVVERVRMKTPRVPMTHGLLVLFV